MTDALPPLPEPDYWSTRDDDTPLFTAAQMESYARAAIAAHVPEAGCGNIAAVPASAEDWLQCLFGATRAHPEWRMLAEAFNAGKAAAAPQAVPADPIGKRRLVTDVVHLSDPEMKPALDRLKRRIATDREFAKSLLPSWSDDELDGLAAAPSPKESNDE